MYIFYIYIIYQEEMVYKPSTYLRLNNLKYDDQSITQVKEYLRTRKLPESLDNSGKRKRFLAKWEKDFKIENDKLVYTPLNLIVVPDDERDVVLKKIYEDITQGVGQGISLLYKRIRDKYLNIRRSDVSAFLKSQKVYQMTKSQNHTINKPIMSSSPNDRWALDCINLVSYASSNGGIDRGYKFILTVVDFFSRKTFLRALKTQTAINVTNALKSIVAETKTYPKIINSDNGGENKAETAAWMKENNIESVKTLSYSPQSNGLVEGVNKKVRKVLREIMIRTNSRNWTNHLQTTANLLNSQVNGTTKQTPNNVWKEGHELQGEQDQSIIRLHEKRIINAIKNNDTTEYKIGNFVRVRMGALYSSVRKLIKSDDKKNIVVNFSPTVYKITRILGKDKADRIINNNVISFEKLRYTLSNLNGTPLATELKKNNPNAVRKSKRFFASDMQLVSDPDKETYLKNFTVQDALKLNKMDKRNDIAVERALPRPAAIVRAVLPLPARVPLVRPPAPVVGVVENYIGKEIENTFNGFGRKLFVGKIVSYDKDNKMYNVRYADGFEQENSLAEIKKYIRKDIVLNVRPQRERRQVIIGGQIHYL
jgi:IS30 family transposase